MLQHLSRFLPVGVFFVLLTPSADADLIANWRLNEGTPGTALTTGAGNGAVESIGTPTDTFTNATVEGSGGTWFNDPIRGVVFSTTEDDRLAAGTQGIDVSPTGTGYTWTLWAKIDSSNLTDPGADVIIGSRNGTWNKLQPTDLQRWAGINGFNVADDTWHMLTITGSNDPLVSLYIDGVLYGSDSTLFNNITVVNDKFEFGGSSNFSEDITGLLSDVAIWNEPLTAGETAGLYGVSSNGDLMYDAATFDLLKQIHDAGTGAIEIGDLTWTYADGLAGSAGLTGANGDYTLVLNGAAGTGLVGSSAPVPEPASLAAWALLALVLGAMRRRRTR